MILHVFFRGRAEESGEIRADLRPELFQSHSVGIVQHGDGNGADHQQHDRHIDQKGSPVDPVFQKAAPRQRRLKYILIVASDFSEYNPQFRFRTPFLQLTAAELRAVFAETGAENGGCFFMRGLL